MEILKTPQTKDRIADQIREEILSGAMSDGTELTQEQLAQLLGVSRMPIREALQILELEGFLLRLPNRRVRVVGRSPQSVAQALRLTAAVEVEIALLLAEQGPPLSPAPDPAADGAFHRWLSDQLDNPYLRQVHEKLLRGYPDYLWRQAAPGAFTARNRRIWAALEAEDQPQLRREIFAYYQALAETGSSRREEFHR